MSGSHSNHHSPTNSHETEFRTNSWYLRFYEASLRLAKEPKDDPPCAWSLVEDSKNSASTNSISRVSPGLIKQVFCPTKLSQIHTWFRTTDMTSAKYISAYMHMAFVDNDFSIPVPYSFTMPNLKNIPTDQEIHINKPLPKELHPVELHSTFFDLSDLPLERFTESGSVLVEAMLEKFNYGIVLYHAHDEYGKCTFLDDYYPQVFLDTDALLVWPRCGTMGPVITSYSRILGRAQFSVAVVPSEEWFIDRFEHLNGRGSYESSYYTDMMKDVASANIVIKTDTFLGEIGFLKSLFPQAKTGGELLDSCTE